MSDAMPPVACPGCGKKYKWAAKYAGRKVRCQCGQVLRMPRQDDVADDLISEPLAAAKKERPAAQSTCPSCGAGVKADAVICVQCGYNIAEGRQVETEVGRAVARGAGGGAVGFDAPEDGFFDKMARSWEFAKISYGIIWDFKSLLIFPICSFIAAMLVLASFYLPLQGTGTLEQFQTLIDSETSSGDVDPIVYVIAFAFYFCNFFVIVFFNTALTACAMKVVDGMTPTVGYGFSIAIKRLPQIVAWALLSAVVGVVLKIIEGSNKQAGRIVSAILGTAWTVLTYFVVPVLCVEGVGPFKAIKQSLGTIKETWGEALVGNFSLWLLSCLIAIPVYLVLGVLAFVAFSGGNTVFLGVVIVLAIVAAVILAAAASAADVIFKAILYNFATGRSVPAELDQSVLSAAFGHKA